MLGTNRSLLPTPRPPHPLPWPRPSPSAARRPEPPSKTLRPINQNPAVTTTISVSSRLIAAPIAPLPYRCCVMRDQAEVEQRIDDRRHRHHNGPAIWRFIAIRTWPSMMFMYIAGMQSPRIASTGAECAYLAPYRRWMTGPAETAVRAAIGKLSSRTSSTGCRAASRNCSSTLFEPAHEVRQPRSRDRDRQKHQSLEEPRRNGVPADDLVGREQREHHEVDPEIDHEEQAESPVRDAGPCDRGHPPDARPRVDPEAPMKPVEIEQHDQPGHRGPAGCDADRPEAQQHDDDAHEALPGLADDVRVRQVLHPLDRLEAGLERLCDLDEDRGYGSQIEHRLRVAVPLDDLSVGERGPEDERRQGHTQDESRADESRCGVGTDHRLAHEVVPRPEPEQHPEDAGDRPRSH